MRRSQLSFTDSLRCELTNKLLDEIYHFVISWSSRTIQSLGFFFARWFRSRSRSRSSISRSTDARPERASLVQRVSKNASSKIMTLRDVARRNQRYPFSQRNLPSFIFASSERKKWRWRNTDRFVARTTTLGRCFICVRTICTKNYTRKVGERCYHAPSGRYHARDDPIRLKTAIKRIVHFLRNFVLGHFAVRMLIAWSLFLSTIHHDDHCSRQ